MRWVLNERGSLLIDFYLVRNARSRYTIKPFVRKLGVSGIYNALAKKIVSYLTKNRFYLGIVMPERIRIPLKSEYCLKLQGREGDWVFFKIVPCEEDGVIKHNRIGFAVPNEILRLLRNRRFFIYQVVGDELRILVSPKGLIKELLDFLVLLDELTKVREKERRKYANEFLSFLRRFIPIFIDVDKLPMAVKKEIEQIKEGKQDKP